MGGEPDRFEVFLPAPAQTLVPGVGAEDHVVGTEAAQEVDVGADLVGGEETMIRRLLRQGKGDAPTGPDRRQGNAKWLKRG